MNAVLISNAVLSVSVLDFRDIQKKWMSQSLIDFFAANKYVSNLVDIIQAPEYVEDSKSVENQIQSYSFSELDYKQKNSFSQNSRSLRLLLAIVALSWVLSLLLFIFMKKFQ